MKAKAGMFTTEISGSVGGHTIQNSNGGLQFRTKPIIKGIPSNAQARIRSIIPMLQQGWRMLSDAQRMAWNLFAPDQRSGHSAYMSAAFDYYKITGGIIEWPSQINPPYIGPELLMNNNFENTSFWMLGPRYVISGGKLRYLNVSSSSASQLVNITMGDMFQIRFMISEASMGAYFTLANQLGQTTFSNPFNAVRTYNEGIHSYVVTATRNSTVFRFYDTNQGYTWAIDWVSLRRYYPE